MTAWRLLLPVLLILAACAGGRVAPPVAAPPPAMPPDDTERLVSLAERWAQAGAHAQAVLLFEEITSKPSSPFTDRALLGLTRSLCNPEYAGRDYRQAYLVADRLVREYPDSHYAVEALAWRDLLLGYLGRGQDLERRTMQLEQATLELEQAALEQERYAQELERLRGVDLQLERRTRELRRRTQELERLKRVDLELERRTQELERLKRLDLELEQRKPKP